MDTSDDLRHWERKLLGGLALLLTTTFGVWAGVVYNGTQQVLVRIDKVVDDATDYRELLEILFAKDGYVCFCGIE